MPIMVKRLSVKAGDADKPLLNGISCTFGNGDITLLVGRNGSGKSTLLDAIGGLVPFEGGVEVDGLPLLPVSRSRQSGAERLGQVFQYPEAQLFARSVQGEFDYSLRYLKLSKIEVTRRTERAMREMSLDKRLREQSPLLLSGGQKRRVALASTFATEPEWLLLDEPTAGLDPEASERLTAYLLERKAAAGGGIVMATHDLDLLLPIADRVIALRDGEIAFDVPASQLAVRPELWERAGIDIPLCAALASRLGMSGKGAPTSFPSPQEAAERLAGRLPGTTGAEHVTASAVVDGSGPNRRGAHSNAPEPEPDCGPEVLREPGQSLALGAPAGVPSSGASSAQPKGKQRRIGASAKGNRWVLLLDPRAKWLFYAALSFGLLAQRSWPGLAGGILLTVLLAFWCQVPWRSTFSLLRPFLWFMAISAVISGIGFGEGGEYGDEVSAGFRIGAVIVSFPAVASTLFEWLKIVCAMIGGIVLSATTTPFAMKRGIERVLSPLARIRFPVEAISLTGSLLLRFIPVLRREADRFNRIAKSRGKRVRASGAMRLRDVPAMLLPLMMSLLQLANDLSLALIARGYTGTGLRRTSSVALRMRGRDWAVVAIGCAVLAALLVVRGE
ncbi:ATP-binding cassette domain-containing protein [Paenibacillus hodogayensis]|uniref:ATP-binding cassette domain-containing protein n=1 Tax=Paenibacillus hodogayensis TaxID=279208 RepID=A0ABV5W7Q5_9BACL